MSSSTTSDGDFRLDEFLPPYPHPNTSPPTYTFDSSDEDTRAYLDTNGYDMHYTTLVHPTTTTPPSLEAVHALSVDERNFESGPFDGLNSSTLGICPHFRDIELERADFENMNASRVSNATLSRIASVFAHGRLRAANSSSTRTSNADTTWPGAVHHPSIALELGQQPAEASSNHSWTNQQPPAYAVTPIRSPIAAPQHAAVSTTPSRSAEGGGPSCKTYCKLFSLAVSLVLFGLVVLAMEKKVKRDLG